MLLGYVASRWSSSLVMATTFQLAHCVEEASFAVSRRNERRDAVWAVHEVETTVDFCPRNRLLTWALGGLNFQIEHHLFPRVPHTHYPQSRRSCRNCPSTACGTLAAVASCRPALPLHTSARMGQLGLAAEIEMG